MARDYEMVLMLDPEAPEGRREEVATETRKRIESGGELEHADTWGTRKMAYEIAQRTEADYRFYRFHAGSELLEQLDHNLKITDGVLRFRIFKVDPGSPTIAPPATAQPAGVSARASRAESRRAEAAAQAAEADTAEEPAESAPEPGKPEEPAEELAEPAEEPAEPAEQPSEEPENPQAAG